MEDSVEFALERVNQVSVDLSNESDYRRKFVDIMNSDLDVLFISSNFAQRHRSLLWNSALSAAESGHLVLVQQKLILLKMLEISLIKQRIDL